MKDLATGKEVAESKVRQRPDRGETFRKWLIDLTPEKLALLTKLEHTARMVAHTRALIGEADDKLVVALMKASDELRKAYEEDKPQ